jgi:hypothetical protein
MSDKTNAVEKPTPTEPDTVACSVCLTEIPESVAANSEADEYTQHFCGTACYDKWRDESEQVKTKS